MCHQGDGVPPTEARDFCDWLTAGTPGDLSHLRYSVLALGDTSYAHFCRCGKSLDAALAAAAAQQLTGRRDVDKEDWGVINEWMEAVVTALTAAPLKTLEQLGGGWQLGRAGRCQKGGEGCKGAHAGERCISDKVSHSCFETAASIFLARSLLLLGLLLPLLLSLKPLLLLVADAFFRHTA
jgi:hypothetical protein